MYQSSQLNKHSKRTIVLLISYWVVIFWVLILKLGVRFSYMEKRSVNLIAFDGPLDTAQLLLNTLIFIPLGLYLGILCRKWAYLKISLLILGCCIIVEGSQYIFAIGAFDITDIITNALGGIIGLFMFVVLVRIFRNEFEAHKVINAIGILGTLIVLAGLFLLRMNMLPIRYR